MIYIILLILSFVLTYLIKIYALKKSLLAEVNERSSHTIPTPHGGGIAIAMTWFLGLIYLFIFNEIEPQLFYALMAGTLLSLVSFLDDIYDLSAKLRLVVQATVAGVGLYFLGGFEILDFGLFQITSSLFNNLFAVILIMWFINLYNFLDGINGYAGSEAIFLALAGFLLFGDNHFLILLVSVLGFLYWNWNQAKIFMGDVGSTLLGYNVAIFTIYYSNQESSDFWIWIVLFSLFWFDATITLLKRALNGEVLSQAHKKHLYQRLTQQGWSHYKVTNWAIVFNSVLLLMVYFVSNVFLVFIMSLMLLYVIMRVIERIRNSNEII